MRYIFVPASITLVDLKTKLPLTDVKGDIKKMSLFDLACDIAFNDRRNFGEGWKAGVALSAIYEKLSVAKEGEVVALESEHYDRFNNSILCLSAETDKDNGIRYDPKILIQILPLLSCVKNALTEDEYKEYQKKLEKDATRAGMKSVPPEAEPEVAG